jgi:hypothetical protein
LYVIITLHSRQKYPSVQLWYYTWIQRIVPKSFKEYRFHHKYLTFFSGFTENPEGHSTQTCVAWAGSSHTFHYFNTIDRKKRTKTPDSIIGLRLSLLHSFLFFFFCSCLVLLSLSLSSSFISLFPFGLFNSSLIYFLHFNMPAIILVK